jgi:hypothetical protein
LVTLRSPASIIIRRVVPTGTIPRLLFLDMATDPAHPILKAFQGSFHVFQALNELLVTMLSNGVSTPRLQDATHTMFTG